MGSRGPVWTDSWSESLEPSQDFQLTHPKPTALCTLLLERLLPLSAAVNEDNGFGNLRESVMGASLDSVEGTGAHPE